MQRRLQAIHWQLEVDVLVVEEVYSVLTIQVDRPHDIVLGAENSVNLEVQLLDSL